MKKTGKKQHLAAAGGSGAGGGATKSDERAPGARRAAPANGGRDSGGRTDAAPTAKERGAPRERSGGRYLPGESGNPAGRPVGSRNRATILAESLVDGRAEKVVATLLAKAERGNTAAMRLVIERLLPKRKERPVSVRIPELLSAADLVQAYSEVLASVARGEMTLGEADAFTTLLDRQRVAIETGELAARVAELEAELAQREASR